ncbi:uncharacterized protein BO95DRAFT_166210 [Aspergillus brunneoviolaceus CBS 621.78]|uniref:Uncharacterized protein n=1 Tax=Aspergillus brunneoviolaceus CBS 621.78 TaxID=1450534 RepID=A0ACD1G6E4_9EURO|nr:hypothetical protein BO95DRAFT_166210 [Aspergillus brunneoviolaceus CBS 621.78]RAH44832.1 hypothetical protein BO95DRAFT_166210 [Aspergillus brunneoviolaceus CBS 621.78]
MNSIMTLRSKTGVHGAEGGRGAPSPEPRAPSSKLQAPSSKLNGAGSREEMPSGRQAAVDCSQAGQWAGLQWAGTDALLLDQSELAGGHWSPFSSRVKLQPC